MRIRHALVVGGGISGLAAALALHRQGWSATVLERAVSPAPVGSGIVLAPNALRALGELGVADEVRACATGVGSIGVRRPDGRWLMRVDATRIRRRFGETFVVLPRVDMVRILADRLPPDSVSLATTVHGVATGGRDQRARVTTTRGVLDADLVVAADGLRSGVRSRLFPAHPGPVHAGFTMWRAVVPAPATPVQAAQTWGRCGVVGVLPMPEDEVYCYATGVVPPGTLFGDERAETLRRFGAWHHPIPDLLAAATPETLLRDDVFHLSRPLPMLHHGRAVLVGDAAHPMTPTLGQGVCQALEDALVLASVLRDDSDVVSRVHTYTAGRQERTSALLRRSATLGRWAHRDSPAAERTRWGVAALLGRLPFDVVTRELGAMADRAPPSLGISRDLRGG